MDIKFSLAAVAIGFFCAGWQTSSLIQKKPLETETAAVISPVANKPATVDIGALTQKLASLKIRTESISSVNDHLVQINGNGEVFFGTPDGTHLMFGDVLDISGKLPVNITLQAKAEKVHAEVTAGHSIDYIAPNEKYSVVIFTDISCGFCKRLHSNIQQYLDKGISIHYLAFPRNGSDTQIAESMRAIWNSNDRKALFDDAMRGNFPAPLKADSLVTQQYEMGRQMGVAGTPAILLPNNQLVPGALSPDELLDALNGKLHN